MSLDQQVLEILNAVEPRLYWMLFQVCLAFFLVLIIKKTITAAVSYIFFRINLYVCIGAPVVIDNKHRGKISNISLWQITVETEEGFLKIPMIGWSKRDWLVLKEKQGTKKNK